MSSQPPSASLAPLLRIAALLKQAPSATPLISASIARADPRDFIRDVLGARPTAAALAAGYTDPWTPDQDLVMKSVMNNRYTAVPAGHAVGKSHVAAWLTLWFLYSHPQSRVVTTAPTARQVEEVLWASIASIWGSSTTRLPGRQLFAKLEVARDWFAIGFSTTGAVGDESATAFQGIHAPGGVLVILDEATGVAPEIWKGAQSLAVGADDRILAIGNPTDSGSQFKAVCDSDRWLTIEMSCLNHPNVLHDNPAIIPGAVSKLWVDDRRDEYGENSPLYKATVLGRWPDQSEDALISLSWVRAAQKPYPSAHTPDGKGAALGIDVAGEGGDLTVVSLVRDGVWTIPTVNGKAAWHVGRDVMQAVKLVQDTLKCNPDIRTVTVDDTGLGSGVSARLRELQREGKIPRYLVATADPLQAQEVSVAIVPRNFGSGAFDDRFADQKHELWWAAREALRNGELKLPSEHELLALGLPKGSDLIAQLTTAIYCTVNGKIEVYDKRSSGGGGRDNPEIRIRIKQLPAKSPDLAHSLLLAWDGYKRLRPRQVYKGPSSTLEIARLQTRAILERSRNRKTVDRRSPWQRGIMR